MTSEAARQPRTTRMSLWRLEWLRMTRTPRAFALVAVFVSIGLIEPVVTKYENKLFSHVGNGVRIISPPPSPADGLNAYVSEVTLIGLIIVVILAAGAFSFDASPGLATFLRTRVASIWQLVTPRFVVYAVGAAIAYLLGTVAAWYETQLLIGPLPAAGMLAGILCGSVYLAFAVAVTALAAAMARTTLGTAGIAFGLLLALPILGSIHVIQNWLPSALVNAPVELVSGADRLTHFLPTLAVTVAASLAALVIAVIRLRAREV